MCVRLRKRSSGDQERHPQIRGRRPSTAGEEHWHRTSRTPARHSSSRLAKEARLAFLEPPTSRMRKQSNVCWIVLTSTFHSLYPRHTPESPDHLALGGERRGVQDGRVHQLGRGPIGVKTHKSSSGKTPRPSAAIASAPGCQLGGFVWIKVGVSDSGCSRVARWNDATRNGRDRERPATSAQRRGSDRRR